MSIDFSIQHSQVQPTSRDTTASSAVTGSLFGNTATVVESPPEPPRGGMPGHHR